MISVSIYFVLLDHISAYPDILVYQHCLLSLSTCQNCPNVSINTPSQYQHQYQYIWIYLIHKFKHQHTFSISARALWLWSGVLGRARQGRRASTSCSRKQVISNLFSFLFFAQLVPGSRYKKNKKQKDAGSIKLVFGRVQKTLGVVLFVILQNQVFEPAQ